MAAILLALLFASSSQAADLEDPEAAVQSGKEALDNLWKYPWYDAQRDDVKPIHVQPPRTPPPARARAGTGAGTGNVMRGLAWTAIVLLLCGLVYLLIKAYLSRETRGAAIAGRVLPDERGRDLDRVEALPFQVKRPDANLLDEARSQYEAGHYSEAIIYLYSYQLVELDRRQWIRLTKGKTNRQYLWELGRRQPLGHVLELTMVAFEDAFFGGQRLSRERFDACWRQLDQFHSLLSKAAA